MVAAADRSVLAWGIAAIALLIACALAISLSGDMVVLAADQSLLLWGIAAIALLIACGLATHRLFGWDPRNMLSSREWQLAGKIGAIAFFLLLLLMTNNSQELPEELFIYGRF